MPNLSTVHHRPIFDWDRLWITSDPHFGHANILRFCDRAFRSIDEMDAALLRNLHEAVGRGDTLLVLGDFCLKKAPDFIDGLMDRLPHCTERILIRGNHDPAALCDHPGWDLVADQLEIRIRDKSGKKWRAFCGHYPMQSWNASGKGSIQLHGHTHGNTPGFALRSDGRVVGGRLDVGVDCWSYKPVRLPDILKRLAELKDQGERGGVAWPPAPITEG